MSLKSTRDRYGRFAFGMHRTLSILIFLQLVGGLWVISRPGADKIHILKLHAPLGVLIGLLALVRIGWWLGFDKRPDDPAGMPRWMSWLAHTVHYLLYVAPLAAAYTGYRLLHESGASQFVFGDAEGQFPHLSSSPGFGAHVGAVLVLVVLLTVHICAAAFHQFIRRDNLLARFGRSHGAPPPTEAPAGAPPRA